jgi:hypothetical protein
VAQGDATGYSWWRSPRLSLWTTDRWFEALPLRGYLSPFGLLPSRPSRQDIYGSSTKAAVQDFQADMDLTADGFAGPQTPSAYRSRGWSGRTEFLIG